MGARSSMRRRNGGFVWRWIGERDLGRRFASHATGHAILWGAIIGLGGRHRDGEDRGEILLRRGRWDVIGR